MFVSVGCSQQTRFRQRHQVKVHRMSRALDDMLVANDTGCVPRLEDAQT